MSQWQPQEYDPRQQQPATPPQWQQPHPGDPRYLPAPYQPPRYPPQPYGYPPYPQQVAPKSVLGAIAISFFLPGVGAMYAGEVGWGILVLALWIISMPLVLVTVGIFTGFVCWIAGMVSGAMAAQKWNREHGIIS